MKIYTKTGDAGETGLFGGPRVRKDHTRVEAYGSVDEVNAALGLARCEPLAAEMDSLLADVQNDLFTLGAELCTPDRGKLAAEPLKASRITALEQAIDRYEATLEPLKEFILPAGTRAASTLHLARTICRRAERRLITLTAQESTSPLTVAYLNRLSDLLFVLARAVNRAAGQSDVPWQKPR